MKNLFLLLLVSVLTMPVLAQKFEVPKDYTLELKEDYAPYEQDVIDAVEWLVSTAISEETKKRKEVNTFLMKWLTGSPNVMIEINSEVLPFMSKCSDCLMIFMGGWAEYSLKEKDFKNKLKGNLAGIEKVIEFYSKNKSSLGKIKSIENLIKMQKKGNLEEHIASQISKE